MAARSRRRGRQRRVGVLRRSCRQPAVRSPIHGIRAAAERHGCRRRASRRRYHRESRHPEAVTFSARLPTERSSNRLTRAVQQARADGRTLVDLTESNPTRAGFAYPSGMLTSLADPTGLVYEPSPFGRLDARQAISRDYARSGVRVAADRIVLTASTSEAYSVLFKLLADADDEVLVPRPSYPLFDLLTRLDLVAARPYDLEYHGSWSIDVGSVERALTPRTRGLLLVSPNNPTGSRVTAKELDQLTASCA